MFTVLLVLHITGGTLALLGGLVAIISQAVHGAHRVHVVGGRIFVVGMALVVVSAIPMSIIIGSVLLGLIAVFSGYLMLTGWRFAKNRSGRPGLPDRALAVFMLVAGVAMLVYGLVTLADQGVILVVFGVLGAVLAVGHLRLLQGGVTRGRARIGNHLQWMFAGFIAAVTAFLVVNVTALGIFVWFLPTIVLTPVAIVWKHRVLGGQRTTLDRAPAGQVS